MRKKVSQKDWHQKNPRSLVISLTRQLLRVATQHEHYVFDMDFCSPLRPLPIATLLKIAEFHRDLQDEIIVPAYLKQIAIQKYFKYGGIIGGLRDFYPTKHSKAILQKVIDYFNYLDQDPNKDSGYRTSVHSSVHFSVLWVFAPYATHLLPFLLSRFKQKKDKKNQASLIAVICKITTHLEKHQDEFLFKIVRLFLSLLHDTKRPYEDTYFLIRISILDMLGKIHKRIMPLLPEMIHLLEQSDDAERCMLLGDDKMGFFSVFKKMGKPTFPFLVKQLSSPDPHQCIHLEALVTLSHFGKEAIPYIKMATQDPRKRIREKARELLKNIK